MTKAEMMAILGPALAGGIGSAVNSRQQGQVNQQNQQNNAVQMQMAALAQKAQMLQGLQQNRQGMAQQGLAAMPLGQEQAYASRAKAMQALLPMLAQYQNARPTDPGIAGATRSSGPNLVQGLAGNAGFQNTFSDQMTSQAMADRRKAIAGVNPQYEFSSLGGFGMDASYDQGVDDARGTALARLKGFEGQQQALADQQVQLALSQGAQQQGQGQEKKGGGVKGFLGGVLKTAAPFAAFIPGVGPLAAIGLGAAGGALGNKMQGNGFVSGAIQGGLGAGIGAAGKSLAGGQGLNPFNNGAGHALNNSMTAASLPQMGIGAPGTGPQLQLPNSMPQQMLPFKQGAQQQAPQMPQLPMFNKADPRGGTPNPGVSTPQGQFSGQGPQGTPMRNAAPYSGPSQPLSGLSGGPTRLERGAPGETMMWDLHGQFMDQPLVKVMQSPIAQVGLGGMIGGQITRPPQGPMKALPPGQYNMGPATPKPYVNTQATNWPAPPQGQLGAGPTPKLLGPGPQAPQVLPPAPMPMGPVGSSSIARGSTFNLPAQSGSTVNNQLNAQQILRVLSGNNGMSPQQKAQFLASPQAQAVLQQLQTAQKLPAGMRPDQIMRLIVGGQ